MTVTYETNPSSDTQVHQPLPLQITTPKELFETILYSQSNHPTLSTFSLVYHPGSPKLAVILDPRYDILMKTIIQNVMYFNNPDGWNLCIISAAEHESAIRQTFPNVLFRPIDSKYLLYDSTNPVSTTPNMTIESYNQILLDIDFWKGFPEEVTDILIFQKDCIQFRPIPSFFHWFDYIGAYYGVLDLYNTSPVLGGINGGFSLRKKQAMITCLEKVTWETIIEYRTFMQSFRRTHLQIQEQPEEKEPLVKNEDVFFTHACELLRFKVPDRFHCSHFSIETDVNINAVGMHGWDKNYIIMEHAIDILKESDYFRPWVSNLTEISPITNAIESLSSSLEQDILSDIAD